MTNVRRLHRRVLCVAVALGVAATIARAQDTRRQWNEAQAPSRVFGNSYYVGTRGLSSLLITSETGHILIDGALPESASLIVANVRRLGFQIEDVKLIVNSHVHFDHAGGIAELQRLSGARIAATASSARVLEQGRSGPDDPQYGELPDIPRTEKVQVISDAETLRVGPLAITAHTTGGHTPGGTSWTWRSCQDGRCLDMVYADSLSAVSADGFSFSSSKDYPTALSDFEKSFTFLSGAPCDILVTPHPEMSDLWGRLARREQGDGDALIDRGACRRYAESARGRLQTRVEAERKP